jgi:hypothetical protein
MTLFSPIKSEDLKRFLSGWERREAPPPPGVYVVEELYSGRLVEEYCARYHLIYLVAVYDRDGTCRDLYQCCSSPPGEDGGIASRCFIFGDVAWREELAEKCRVETYLYRFGDIRDALRTLLEFGMHVKGIPCTYFSLPVLKVTGWCEVDPICCDVSTVREKLIESASQRLDMSASPRRGEGDETDGASGGGESTVEGAPSKGGELANSSEAGGGCGELIRRVAEDLGVDVDSLKTCLCRW